MSYSVEVNILCDADLSQTGVNRCCGYVGGEPMDNEAGARASARAIARRQGWHVQQSMGEKAICPACLRVKQLAKGQEPAA